MGYVKVDGWELKYIKHWKYSEVYGAGRSIWKQTEVGGTRWKYIKLGVSRWR